MKGSPKLLPFMHPGIVEAGCDEAGRGPLAGPVFAASVVLPTGFDDPRLNDSKQMSETDRDALREIIERDALAWTVERVDPEEIDRLNILHASTHAMCLAVKALLGEQLPGVICQHNNPDALLPEFLLIDGNRFYNETPLPYQCIVKGDAKMMPIAAASILAKTHRDQIMDQLHSEYPVYGWDRNKGYPTAEHYQAIEQYGVSPYHRHSFTLYRQHTLFE